MRHFLAAGWKARMWREGHTWEKGDAPPTPQTRLLSGHFGSRPGRPRRRPRGAHSPGTRGEPGGRARLGPRSPRRLPAGARSGRRGAQTGRPAGPGRVPAAAARGRGGRGEGRPAECPLPPGEEIWGPGPGAGRAGLRGPGTGDPRRVRGAARWLASLPAPPRGRLRAAAGARARCGAAGAPGGQGGVPGGPPEDALGAWGRSLLAGLSPRHAAPDRRAATAGAHPHLLASFRARLSSLLRCVQDWKPAPARSPPWFSWRCPRRGFPKESLPLDCHLMNKCCGNQVLKAGNSPARSRERSLKYVDF